MLLIADILLFLLPVGLYVLWRIAGSSVPRWVVWMAVAATLLTAAGAITYGLDNAIPRDATYEPAHIVDGRIVPGHAAPKPR